MITRPRPVVILLNSPRKRPRDHCNVVKSRSRLPLFDFRRRVRQTVTIRPPVRNPLISSSSRHLNAPPRQVLHSSRASPPIITIGRRAVKADRVVCRRQLLDPHSRTSPLVIISLLSLAITAPDAIIYTYVYYNNHSSRDFMFTPFTLAFSSTTRLCDFITRRVVLVRLRPSRSPSVYTPIKPNESYRLDSRLSLVIVERVIRLVYAVLVSKSVWLVLTLRP